MENTSTSPAAQTSPSSSPAVLVLTPGAVEQVKAVLKEQKIEGGYLVVRVVPAGCSGLGYDLNLVNDTRPGDVTWAQDGVKMATDPMSEKYLSGTTLDYVKTDTAAGFRFSNPNAKSTCGCGSSFSA